MNFANFVQTYAPTIMYGVLTAIAGFLGAWFKRLYDRITADQTKRAVAETVVKAIEQMYKKLSGEEKKQRAIDGIRQMLEAKGITIADIEIEMLLEAAVAEFNKQRVIASSNEGKPIDETPTTVV